MRWISLLPWLATTTLALYALQDPGRETPDEAKPPRGWTRGKGWGWVYGAQDEVGALNAIEPASVRRALGLVREGRIYDLGVTFDRASYKWPGHSPTEVMTFRSPEGLARQKDWDLHDNEAGTAWHSCALFLSDNVGTQIDGLGHVTAGEDDHWYNGFREADWGGDFGPRRCDASTIPPIVTRGVLIDVAGHLGVDALPAHHGIGVEELRGALERQGTAIEPGDAVFVRTGCLRHWGTNGADHETLARHDSAGLTLPAARWLVEERGAILVGSDTSGLEVGPPPVGSKSPVPVHDYLLVQQGVHIAEFHFLEELARDRVHVFCYVALTQKLRGTTAGFCMRPIAIR